MSGDHSSCVLHLDLDDPVRKCAVYQPEIMGIIRAPCVAKLAVDVAPKSCPPLRSIKMTYVFLKATS